MTKLLCETTEADAKAAGFKSLGTFVDAWLDKHGSWDPREVITDDLELTTTHRE
jgi:hypothetical protein